MLFGWNLDQVETGNYEIAFETQCTPSKLAKALPDATNRVSDIVAVNIDLITPSILGAPQPTGSAYIFPATFRVSFTETIDCSRKSEIFITATSNLVTLKDDDLSYYCEDNVFYWNFADTTISNVSV